MTETTTGKIDGQENPITEASLDKAVVSLQTTIKKFGTPIWYVITAVILILLVGFVTMLLMVYQVFIDASNNKEGTYQNLANQIVTQNTKINNLTTQLEIYSKGKIK